MNPKPPYRFEDLVAIVRRLRGENGCPWDNEQTIETIRKYFLEEAYEALDAIDRGDMPGMREELGDVIWEVLFLARIAEQDGAFTVEDMCDELGHKMVRRHPHIFGGEIAETSDAVAAKWMDIKKKEGKAKSHAGVLKGIPQSMPALLRAQRIGERVAKIGYDWKDAASVIDKIREETAELAEVVDTGDLRRIEAEFGDLLFSLAQTARHLGISAEDALRGAADKFINRIDAAEKILNETGGSFEGMGASALDELWERAKARGGKGKESADGTKV